MMGWICPRCQKVHAPHVSGCDCAAPTFTSGYWQTACPGCGKYPCDGSKTACPPPVKPTITVSVGTKPFYWYAIGSDALKDRGV